MFALAPMGALAAPVKVEISPPDIAGQIICDPQPTDKDLTAFWSAWDGHTLPDRQAGLLRRDLRQLRKLDAARWAPVLRQAYGVLPQIDTNFGQDAAALAEVELLLALGQLDRLKQSRLVPQLLQGAAQKSPRTQKNLAHYLRLGLGVEADAKTADRLLVNAAYGGNADALLALAHRSLDGENIPGWDVDPALAVSMGFTALIGKFDAFICNRVSRIAREYRAGTLVVKNHVLADQWYQFSARLGDPSAAWKVAQTHLRAEDLYKDNAVLLQHLTQAAQGGIGPAQLALAQAYHQGALLPKDPQMAAQYYAMAAASLGRVGVMRQAVFLGDSVKTTPDSDAPMFDDILGTLNRMSDGPGWALRRVAKNILTKQGRWHGADDALSLLDQAAQRGDSDAMQQATVLRFHAAQDLQRFQALVDKLSNLVVQHGHIESMKLLQTAFTCQAPDAPRIPQALYWQAATRATGVDTANALPALAVEPIAVAQTQALYGRATALASYLDDLRRTGATADMQTLWSDRATHIETLPLAQGKIAFQTLDSPGGIGALRRALKPAIDRGQAQANTLLATALLTGGRRVPVQAPEPGSLPRHPDMYEISMLLHTAAQNGAGQAMSLLRQTPEFSNRRAVFLAYAEVIDARGDFDALLLALPYLEAPQQASYIRRAIAIAPCDFTSSVQFSGVLAHIGQIEQARQWLSIARFIAEGNSQRQINLGDAYVRVLGHGGLGLALAAYERAYRAGKSAAAGRLLKHYGDENSPAFDPDRAFAIAQTQSSAQTTPPLAGPVTLTLNTARQGQPK